MTAPSSPRGWLSWAASVSDSYHRPFSRCYELAGKTDRRVNDARETAISIIRLLERSANGNGGAGLIFDFYTRDVPWEAFSDREKVIIAKTARAFASRLREAGFLPREG